MGSSPTHPLDRVSLNPDKRGLPGGLVAVVTLFFTLGTSPLLASSPIPADIARQGELSQKTTPAENVSQKNAGRLPENFLADPWVLKDPETKDVLALVSIHSQNHRVKGTPELSLDHRVTYYVRRDQLTTPFTSGMESQLAAKVRSGELRVKDNQAPLLAQEDLFTAPDGSLRAYRFKDPTTREGFLMVVHGQRAQVFQGEYICDWSDERLDAWLMAVPADPKLKGAIDPDYSVPWSADSIVGAQLADRILKQWNHLSAGPQGVQSSKKIVYDLFVPFRRGFFAFEAERLSSGRKEGKSPEESARRDLAKVKVAASNWLIKPFAPEILFTMRCEGGVTGCQKNPRVLSYLGPSPIEFGGSRYPTIRLEPAGTEGPGT